MTDLVSQLVGALKYCQGVFMAHEINRVNGDQIADDALDIIRSALTAAKAGRYPPESRKERIARLQVELDLLRKQEAKEVVDAAYGNLKSECLALVDARLMVEAIKHYRKAVGSGLVEAKYAVDAIVAERNRNVEPFGEL